MAFGWLVCDSRLPAFLETSEVWVVKDFGMVGLEHLVRRILNLFRILCEPQVLMAQSVERCDFRW